MFIHCASGPHKGNKYWVIGKAETLVVRRYDHSLYRFAHYHITDRKSSEGNLIAVHVHSSSRKENKIMIEDQKTAQMGFTETIIAQIVREVIALLEEYQNE